MTSREKFEAWMTAEQWFHGSDFEWDERRNCYAQFGIHLAYKAFLAAEGAAEQKLTDMAVQLANAESKCRELAGVVAENAALKTAAEFATAPDMWIEQADGMLDYRYVDWYVDVLKAAMETPATDAFLAEVRAQGVEMLLDSLPAYYTARADIAEFAAQLRKGAAL
ncbi:hypothetical protein LT980_07135 [Citrobacter portucalensis]|uniref:hypothetical protein n=1 Tax=Citrobacter portucalensis TaxID=1639133 RepID=UPI00202CE33E|nr:hypothetical protein [Citrobacter portucalensis]URR14357.1 hypothetical protein LT980_07135 [Citrobacter portucalensis]